MAIYNVSTDTPFLNKITIMCRKTRSENLPLYYSSLDFKLSFRIGSRSHVLKYKDVLKSLENDRQISEQILKETGNWLL